MAEQDSGSLQGELHLKPLVSQTLREGHGQPPATEQMRDKKQASGLLVQRGLSGSSCSIPGPLLLQRPPPLPHHPPLSSHYQTPPPCSHLSPPPACTQPCGLLPLFPHPQVWMGPYDIEGWGQEDLGMWVREEWGDWQGGGG